MLVLIVTLTLFLFPCALAQTCCPPSRTYEGDVYSVLLGLSLKYAVDLDAQTMVMYSDIPALDYFDFVDANNNVAYEHFGANKCFAVHPYPFGCIPTGATELNETTMEAGKEYRIFQFEAPFDQGHRNFTTEWYVDEDCVTVKQSMTYPFRNPFEYFYSHMVENITDTTVFDRNLSDCHPLGTPMELV